MKELSGLDLRFRKDLPILRRFSSEAAGEPLPKDKVSLGQGQVASGNAKGGESFNKEHVLTGAPAQGTSATGSLLMEEPTISLIDEAPLDATVGLVTFADLAKAATQTVPPAPTVVEAVEPPRTTFGSMLMGAVSSLLGVTNEASFNKELQAINKLEAQTQKLKTAQDFQAKTAEFKQRLANGESLDDIRVEAYAVARQAAKLATGLRPFDCQVTGALAMNDGHVAEMKTGEGKTLAAIMPLYLNALEGKGAHLVTVNDTLAARDADFVKPAFELMGMSVGCVFEDMDADQKRQGYSCDVTYTTDRTLGFDYLRDRTATRPEDRVQREPYFALVDELDEVLLDEARTPLIISGKTEPGQNYYSSFNTLVQRLQPGDDFQAEPEKNTVWLTDLGLEWVQAQLQLQSLEQLLKTTVDPAARRSILADQVKVEQLAQAVRAEQAAEKAVKQAQGSVGEEKAQVALEEAQKGKLASASAAPGFELYDEKNDHLVYYLEAALKANVLFNKGKDYIVDQDGVQIVDKNKGRTSEGRRYSSGLHQALEAKEGVAIQAEQRTTASITYPNLFNRYQRLAGMSGTAWTSKDEIFDLYGLQTVQISPNRPMARKDELDEVFKTQEEKYAAVARDAARDFFEGRPVLIGTLSVEHNNYVVAQLLAAGVPEASLQVLNAESVRGNKEAENEIIADAGRSGVITVATNMAGRGADIKPDLINFKKIAMEVSEAHEAGRPVILEVAKEKDAQWLAQWLEGCRPKIVDESSKELPQAGQVVIRVGKKGIKPSDGLLLDCNAPKYETGGLTVYGTERGDSRRIDDQLIGRAGRQGAKGRSKFYLSLEDELFTKHGGSGIAALKMLFTQGPGQGLSGKMFSKLIDLAQANSEATHTQLRKITTEQDKTLNLQREAYFGLRDQVVENEGDIRDRFTNMAGAGLANSVQDHLPDKKSYTVAQLREAVAKASEELGTSLALPWLDPGTPDSAKVSAEEVRSELLAQGLRLTEKALQGQSGDLRDPMLEVMDSTWSDHLDEMDALKTASEWQKAAQLDPEVFFKLQSAEVFDQTLANLDRNVLLWVFSKVKP